MKEEILKQLLEIVAKDNIRIDEPMSKHTTFKIGGNADFFLRPTSEEELKHIMKVAKNNNIPITVIGNGSNVLVKDEGIRGFVIKPNFKYIKIVNKKNDSVEVIEKIIRNNEKRIY